MKKKCSDVSPMNYSKSNTSGLMLDLSPNIAEHIDMNRFRQLQIIVRLILIFVLIQVYNEQIRDLLMPGGYLPVREDPQRGVMITGLSLHKVWVKTFDISIF